MDTRIKANPNAATDKPPVLFSDGATFLGDSLGISPDAGGVLQDGGQLYSVARPELVAAGEASQRTGEGWQVQARRTGRIALLDHSASQPTTYGAELESVHMAQDGSYADLDIDTLLAVNELYSFMYETGTKPTDDPDEFKRRYWDMVHDMVDRAEQAGHFTAALSVFAQNEPSPEQINPSIYVGHVARAMAARTGFDTLKLFRTGGAQGHAGVSNTMAAVKAMEAMQYLDPLLMAPTLSGPLLEGGMAARLAGTDFTPQQAAHLARAGISTEDLSKPYQSWRYLLRRVGSPSAGIWQEPAPDTQAGYLQRGHDKLANGDINNIDRVNGWHTDRVRVVLDGSGANTGESCAEDTMLGNPNTIVPLQRLRAAIFTSLEQVAIRGRDPRLLTAHMLGTASLSRQARLDLAHHLSLREVSRYGTDANTYKHQRPGEWLGALLQIADDAPFTRVTTADRAALRRMYATWNETVPAMRAWCMQTGETAPTAQAYFDLGINNPAVYMRSHYVELRRQRGQAADRQGIVRSVELVAARALHNASHIARKAA